MYDVIVRDAAGFTFWSSYPARSTAGARRAFWAAVRRLGKKTKFIRVLEVTKVR